MNGQKILMTLMGMEIGGAETHVLELCKALTKRGMRVYVASNGGAYEPELTACGIVHYRVPLHNKRLDNLINAYFTLKKIIQQNDIHLVHAHARIPGFLCGLLQKRLRFRFVTTAHWVFSTEFPFNLLSDWGEKCLAVSGDIRQYLKDNYHVPDENIYDTVNGIDTDAFSPDTSYDALREEFGSPLTGQGARILSLSRLDRDRSLVAHLLIQSAPALIARFPETVVFIVGGGDDFNTLKREAERVNKQLGSTVIYLTGKRTDVNRWMASCDIFVNSSRAVLEAMSSGKPVVAAGNEGYLGLLTPENLPMAVETNFCYRGLKDGTQPSEATAEKLTRDLLTLLSMTEEERREMGKFGRTVVLTRYSVDCMAEDAIRMYKAVLHSPWPKALTKQYDTDVMISGYYGHNNSGDDILLQSIVGSLRQYREDIRVTVLSRHPKETRAQYGVTAVHRFNFISVFLRLRHTHVLLTGGGSVIQDETSTQSLFYYLWVINMARRLGVKNMLYANGIGPVSKPGNMKRVRQALNRVDLITLRDRESLHTLHKIGVTTPETHVTADAAFALPPTDDAHAKRCLEKLGVTGRFFCVAIRSWKNNPPELEQQVALFADYASDTYCSQALFVPMHPAEDADISKRIMALMTRPAVLMSSSPDDLDDIRCVTGLADFVLGMRLHALIYAVGKGVPMIGLVYDPKIKQLMDSMQQRLYTPVETVDAQTLMGYADEIYRNREAISNEIRKAGREARERAAVNARLCAALLEQP